jgi:hypothetical protein
MTREARRSFRVSSLSVEQVNFALGLIADRMDEIEGRRGTPQFKNNVDMDGNRIVDAAGATDGTDAVIKDQLDSTNSTVAITIASMAAHIASKTNPHVTTLEQVVAEGGSATGDITPKGRLIVPMGEINYFDTTGTSIVIVTQSDGSTNMVVANPATTLSSGGYEFDNGGSNNGRLRYTGSTTKMFHVACTISIAPTSANDVFVCGIAKNGTVINGSKVLFQAISSSQARSTALHTMVELATNDYVELYLGNTTDADDVTVLTENLFAMGM